MDQSNPKMLIPTSIPFNKSYFRVNNPKSRYFIWSSPTSFLLKKMVLRTGFEPAIFAVKGRCPNR